LLLGRLDPVTGEITYCNAGHPPAVLLRANGQVEELGCGGPLLGALTSPSFTNGTAVLQPGDTLLGYSDGITECCNAAAAAFGVEGLRAAAANACNSGVAATLFSVLAAVEDFAGSLPREDDFALIVAHRNAD
jgi:phosphoserine phosphatase RsbU/P